MSGIIGIDLGTTNSLAAHLTDQGPDVIPNALGERLTPSVVGIDLDGKLVVGRGAKELQVTQPDRCAGLFKRYMGSDWQCTLGDQEFTPEKLSSLLLRTIKEDAEAHLQQPIERAVITVPAYFNDQQRNATINAGKLAGLQVERIINEPTAAALAYGFHESQEEKILLVFDLGGGTFDVSLVELFEGSVEVRASSGESFLGGEDFTRTLAARVLEQRGYTFERIEVEAPKLVSRILQQCEKAKCLLSKQPSAAVRMPNLQGEFEDDSPTITIETDHFRKWTENILARVELPIRRALGDAKLARQDVDEIILVGGATRMPTIVEFVSKYFGKEPRHRLHPDEVVALGAAVQAGLIGRSQSVDDLVVTDVCPFTLGVETTHRFGGQYRPGYFLPIIHRNTTIPVSEVKPVSTISPNQTEITIKIFQGESRKVDGNLFLGEFTVKGIPRAPAGEEQVDIRFTYDLNGILEVEATVLSTKQRFSHLVTKYARSLSEADLQQAISELDTLKSHPREETANRFLLRRAERLYEELPMGEREMLSELLDGFEDALDLKDTETIDRYRQALEDFLERFDGDWNEEEQELE